MAHLVRHKSLSLNYADAASQWIVGFNYFPLTRTNRK
jgi:hypothetical protein